MPFCNNNNLDMLISFKIIKYFFLFSLIILSSELNAEGSDSDSDIARVSLIGAGMKAESGIASKMFSILGKNKINIAMISTSPIRISCVVSKSDMQKAIDSLHEEFIEI